MIHSNYRTRWFTNEYTLWFDLTLPGLQWLKTALPLGGTSNHFRTATLRQVGAWDPFNVTEDCDLGLRLAQHKLRTIVLDSTTMEEANSRPKNWIRQRSRWIKGYLQTYLVHMRRPFSYVRDGRVRDFLTLLYGYGGFNIPQTPVFAPNRLAWLERGGIFAVANLRGGSEYGEEWHTAGMRENKQNVFNDFITAAEWLIAERYTRTPRLAIEGGSNGGLLVAACEVQRPDLFGAVLCRVPLTDMLRYHRFTIGRYWVGEYGNAECDPDQFRILYAYSPLHQVQPGTSYPPTLIMSADTDDRVVPAHAKKFAATLQWANAGPHPILLRVETKAGHGIGKPTAKLIEEQTDMLAFLLSALRA